MTLAEDRGTGVKASGTPALPDFWETVFQNSEEFQEMVEEYDEPVLEYLQDVTSEWIVTKIKFLITAISNTFLLNSGKLQRFFRKHVQFVLPSRAPSERQGPGRRQEGPRRGGDGRTN